MFPNYKKISLEKCREIMNKDGLHYTDKELLKVRDFLYRITEITSAHYERVKERERNGELTDNDKKLLKRK